MLELGGSDPFIVMPSADLERAASVAVTARNQNNGQSCIAAKRFIVHEAVADEFERLFAEKLSALKIGDPMAEDTKIGPLALESGIGDLEALARDTHKFESRYLDGLIGPYPERRDLYVARSPIHSARTLSVPVAFFQGAEDRIVPPEQAEEMVEALRRRRIPFLYLLFDGEQHGFRRADNIKRALDAELYFYATFLTDQKLSFRIANG